jgi:hypothetical protein
MHDISTTGKPDGVLNDYDLASWDKFPTTNSDITGTVPFMALNILADEFEKRCPRLYRHDAESFIWVLAYITLVSVQYNNGSVKISRPHALNCWFAENRNNHLNSKQALPRTYGLRFPVAESYKRYLTTTRNLTEYWVQLDCTLFDLRAAGSTGPEIDGPRDTLGNLIKGMDATFGANVEKEWEKLKVRLREVAGIPETA